VIRCADPATATGSPRDGHRSVSFGGSHQPRRSRRNLLRDNFVRCPAAGLRLRRAHESLAYRARAATAVHAETAHEQPPLRAIVPRGAELSASLTRTQSSTTCQLSVLGTNHRRSHRPLPGPVSRREDRAPGVSAPTLGVLVPLLEIPANSEMVPARCHPATKAVIAPRYDSKDLGTSREVSTSGLARFAKWLGRQRLGLSRARRSANALTFLGRAVRGRRDHDLCAHTLEQANLSPLICRAARKMHGIP